MNGAFPAIIRRDLRLCFSRGTEGAVALFFFCAVVSLFPFALGGDAELLRRAAPGVVWTAALLSALLSLDAVWHRDFEDGTLDLLLLAPVAPLELAAAKALSHWVLAGAGLVIAAAPAGLMLMLPPAALGVLLPSLALGTLYMSLLGALGAGLTLGARRPGLLLALLVLPLCVPMLVFGMLAMEAALDGRASGPYILLQAALVVAALPLALGAAAKMLETGLRSG